MMRVAPPPPSRPPPPVAHAGLGLLLAAAAVRDAAAGLCSRWATRRAPRARVVLPRGGVLALRTPRGLTAACLRGTAWITRSRDATDHLLGAGDEWHAPGRGRVVIQALEDAELVLRMG
jgi:hypothetical protein